MFNKLKIAALKPSLQEFWDDVQKSNLVQVKDKLKTSPDQNKPYLTYDGSFIDLLKAVRSINWLYMITDFQAEQDKKVPNIQNLARRNVGYLRKAQFSIAIEPSDFNSHQIKILDGGQAMWGPDVKMQEVHV
ncbi:MAG: hypothetical protein HQK56_20290 [Deltaproteobacteria bacterium]|nr:hypothetical protein [Deltaproteobacteria bacterium]